jgi:hypothetical protein
MLDDEAQRAYVDVASGQPPRSAHCATMCASVCLASSVRPATLRAATSSRLACRSARGRRWCSRRRTRAWAGLRARPG